MDAGCIIMGLTVLQKNVFKRQSKIYAYMIPHKCSGICYPLQQENSFALHKVKCQVKSLSGIFRKPGEKRNAGNTIQSSMKSEEQKIKDSRRGPVATFPNQKSEAAEPPKSPCPTCESTHTVTAKQTLKNQL
ncbi:N-lysine methyltransferase KMT5A [Lemmus lemmus]